PALGTINLPTTGHSGIVLETRRMMPQMRPVSPSIFITPPLTEPLVALATKPYSVGGGLSVGAHSSGSGTLGARFAATGATSASTVSGCRPASSAHRP